MNIKYFFKRFHHFFRGLAPLKLKIFNPNLNISNNTQNSEHSSSRESIINTSLHHTMKIKDFNFFFGFRQFCRGLTPLKLKNFVQNLNISNNTQNFAHSSS